MSEQKLSTKALHAGQDTNLSQGTRAVPIYQSTSYVFNDSEHAANLFALAEPGYIYTRLNNPTNDILEQRLAALEGGDCFCGDCHLEPLQYQQHYLLCSNLETTLLLRVVFTGGHLIY